MRARLTKIGFLFIAMLISGGTFNCSSNHTTAPNHVSQLSYPDAYKDLKLLNPLLASELNKLPELQDGISNAEALALSQIFELYNEHPGAFDKAFKRMYQVGMPKVRKYCSPLQALFWLVENGELKQTQLSIQYYNLTALLNRAWLPELYGIINEDIKNIISAIKEDAREDYVTLYNRVGKITFWNYICSDYKKNLSYSRRQQQS